MTAPVMPGDAKAISFAHGITPVSETAHHVDLDVVLPGARMEHGSFGPNAKRTIGEEVRFRHEYAFTPGSLTNRPPAGSATWSGIMAGTSATGDGGGERLVGTAVLNNDIAASE